MRGINMVDKDVGLLTWIIGGLMTIISSVLGVVWKRHTDTKQLVKEVDNKLTAHMLDVSSNYPRTNEVREMLKPLNDKVDDIRDDVKMLVNHHLTKGTKN